MIIKASKDDLNEILDIIKMGKELHMSLNLDQWNVNSPSDEEIINAIDKFYCLKEDGVIKGVMTLNVGVDKDYDDIDGSWITNSTNYLTIHRLAVNKNYYHEGIGSKLMEYAINFAYRNQLDSVRIDTHNDNSRMKGLIFKYGFKECGRIKINKNLPRIGFELKLKRGLIITNAFSLTDSTKKVLERYYEEFKNLNVVIDHKTNKEVLVYLDNDKLKANLDIYDFILYLDKDKHISKMLEKMGYHLFNNSDAIEISDDKMLTHIALSNNKIKMPKTISSPLYYGGTDDGEFIEKVIKIIGFPMIVKEVFGSFGKQVHLVTNKDELVLVRDKLKYVPHIYQEFINTSYGTDIRVIVINKKVVASMKRISSDDFRSNIELGAKGYPIILNDEIIKSAEKIATILNLDYCGLDFLIGQNDEPILCEVNSNAMFNEIEKVTKINVCKLYCEHIYKTIYGGENND